MTANELNKAIGGIDEKIVDEAAGIDTAEKFAALSECRKRRKISMTMKICVSAAACLAIAAGVMQLSGTKFTNVDKNNSGISTSVNSKKDNKTDKKNSKEDERTQIANPIMELDSAETMEKYLGYSVPVISEKTVDSYLVFAGDDSYAYMGEINYTDGITYRIAKGSEDISGMCGGEETEKDNINGYDIDFYTLDGKNYAVWQNEGFSFAVIGGEDMSEVRAAIESVTA